MHSKALLLTTLLSASMVAATRPLSDVYTFWLTAPYECYESCADLQTCGSSTMACPIKGSCGAWGGKENYCCTALNHEDPEKLCTNFTSTLKDFDVSKDGTAPLEVGADEPCPTGYRAVTAGIKDKKGTTCCPDDLDGVTEQQVALSVSGPVTAVRCIPAVKKSSNNDNNSGGSQSTGTGSGGSPSTTATGGSGSSSTPNAGNKLITALGMIPVAIMVAAGL